MATFKQPMVLIPKIVISFKTQQQQQQQQQQPHHYLM